MSLPCDLWLRFFGGVWSYTTLWWCTWYWKRHSDVSLYLFCKAEQLLLAFGFPILWFIWHNIPVSGFEIKARYHKILGIWEWDTSQILQHTGICESDTRQIPQDTGFGIQSDTRRYWYLDLRYQEIPVSPFEIPSKHIPKTSATWHSGRLLDYPQRLWRVS